MENISKTITLWHGGRNLHQTYREMVANKKWEHGPGLYLSTHYETAREHMKGGGSLYMVTVEEGRDLDDVNLPIDSVRHFVEQYVAAAKRSNLLSDIEYCMSRMRQVDSVCATNFLNLIINLDAIKNSRTPILQQYLVDNGVDYSITKNCRGRSETYLTVMNLKKVLKVKKVSASDISPDQYILPGEFAIRN